jgi:hypothetical protein
MAEPVSGVVAVPVVAAGLHVSAFWMLVLGVGIFSLGTYVGSAEGKMTLMKELKDTEAEKKKLQSAEDAKRSYDKKLDELKYELNKRHEELVERLAAIDMRTKNT